MTHSPGIHRMTDAEYHADPAPVPSLSSTLARVILNQSPLHAWTQHPRLNPDREPVEKKTFDIGRAAHRAVLGAGGGYIAIPEEMLASNGAASTKAAKEFIEDADAARAADDNDDPFGLQPTDDTPALTPEQEAAIQREIEEENRMKAEGVE